MKGIYCLIIKINKNIELKIGKLGNIEFDKGIPTNAMSQGLYLDGKYLSEINVISSTRVILTNGSRIDNSLLQSTDYKIGPIQK